MTTRARDLASPTVASLRRGDTAGFALGYLHNLGIHAGPVLDDDGQVVGLLSRSDLCGCLDDDRVEDRMRAPVVALSQDLDLDAVSRAFAEGPHHHMPVVDSDGAVVGMISVLDVLRVLMGEPVDHPVTFDCHEPCACWSRPAWLTTQAPDFVPDEPGVIVIFDPEDHDRLVWAGKSDDRQATLRSLLLRPPADMSIRLHAGPLRFRHASRSAI